MMHEDESPDVPCDFYCVIVINGHHLVQVYLESELAYESSYHERGDDHVYQPLQQPTVQKKVKEAG